MQITMDGSELGKAGFSLVVIKQWSYNAMYLAAKQSRVQESCYWRLSSTVQNIHRAEHANQRRSKRYKAGEHQ